MSAGTCISFTVSGTSPAGKHQPCYSLAIIGDSYSSDTGFIKIDTVHISSPDTDFYTDKNILSKAC
jgi:hypothetical protein